MKKEKDKPLPSRNSSFYSITQMFAPSTQNRKRSLPSEPTQRIEPSFKKARQELDILLAQNFLAPKDESRELPSSPASGSENSLFPIASKKESKESISPPIQNENLPPSPGKN